MADPKTTKPVTEAADDAKAGLAGGRKENSLVPAPEGPAAGVLGTAGIPPVGARKTFDQVQEEKNAKGDKSSLKIRIELDLDVEVHLTARVRGDITIGLLTA
ncbi:uncharacterized protein RCC_06373 [Ramularia collo-cygni]|uniref:Uncharacterized protein n=1 Tax=Ramularia collo-cygni TaxID=112498 RepID=A0A2D3VI84_9PEZI|nr:uncharacterized protein RCC_06373 [Ramularia collo-cygni]CZT20513.1 uncharacterized protein RCC_06373 [Ramularia collo-cygni]